MSKTKNIWLTQGSTLAADMTQHTVKRKNLDLDSAIDLASGDDDEIEIDNPMLVAAAKEYRTVTNVE